MIANPSYITRIVRTLITTKHLIKNRHVCKGGNVLLTNNTSNSMRFYQHTFIGKGKCFWRCYKSTLHIIVSDTKHGHSMVFLDYVFWNVYFSLVYWKQWKYQNVSGVWKVTFFFKSQINLIFLDFSMLQNCQRSNVIFY